MLDLLKNLIKSEDVEEKLKEKVEEVSSEAVSEVKNKADEVKTAVKEEQNKVIITGLITSFIQLLTAVLMSKKVSMENDIKKEEMPLWKKFLLFLGICFLSGVLIFLGGNADYIIQTVQGWFGY